MMHKRMAASSPITARTSSITHAAVSVGGNLLEHRLAAGRAFEEMALRLVMEGFVVAMHAGITEVEAPNMALRGRLRTFQRPTVVFRVGKSLRQPDAERARAARPQLADALY